MGQLSLRKESYVDYLTLGGPILDSESSLRVTASAAFLTLINQRPNYDKEAHRATGMRIRGPSYGTNSRQYLQILPVYVNWRGL